MIHGFYFLESLTLHLPVVTCFLSGLRILGRRGTLWWGGRNGDKEGRLRTLMSHLVHLLSLILRTYHLLSLSRSRSRVSWASQPVRPSIYLNIKHIELLHSTSEYVMDNLGPGKTQKNRIWSVKTSKFAWELYIYRFPTFVAHTFEDWLRWRYLSYLNVCSKISGEDLSGSKCPAWSHPLLPSSFPPARVTLTEAHVTLTLTPGHHFPLCLLDSRGTPVQCAESRVWSCSERVEREQENITEFHKVSFPVSSASFRLGGSPFLFPWQVCFWHLN